MAGSRIPKVLTRCPSCPREIGARPDWSQPGAYRVAAHPGCDGGGIQVAAEQVWPNPLRKVS